MAFNFVDFFTLVRELVGNNEKMDKFREIVADVKELIADIKDVVAMFQKV